MSASLEHIVCATNRPQAGNGTRRHLLGLKGNECYLEMIPADFDQNIIGTISATYLSVQPCGLYYWAARRSDLVLPTNRPAVWAYRPQGRSPFRGSSQLAPGSHGSCFCWEAICRAD